MHNTIQDGLTPETALHQSYLNNYIPGHEGDLKWYIPPVGEVWAKTVFGSWIHEMIEKLIKQEIDIDKIDYWDELTDFLNKSDKILQYTMNDTPKKIEAWVDKYAEIGKQMLEGVYEKYIKQILTEDSEKFVEKPFSFFFEPENVWLAGTMDLVLLSEGGSLIPDWKTNGVKQNLAKTIQPEIYTLWSSIVKGVFAEFKFINLECFVKKTKEPFVQDVPLNVIDAEARLSAVIQNWKKLTQQKIITLTEKEEEPMENQIVPMSSLQENLKLGEVFALSGWFKGDSYDDVEKQKAQAIVKIIAGQDLGLTPMASMSGINIIKGKPEISANIMAALIKRSEKYSYEIKEFTHEKCVIAFSENGKVLDPDSEFTIADAIKAKLAKPDSNWDKFPRNMLFARAMSNGFKWHCPDLAMMPVYTEGEISGVTNEMQQPNISEKKDVPKIKPTKVVVLESSEKEIQTEEDTDQEIAKHAIAAHAETVNNHYDENMALINKTMKKDEAKVMISGKTACAIFGVDIQSEFKGIHCLEEIVLETCQDIWNNPEKYSKYEQGEDAYYKFLKFLWVRYPNGVEERLADIVDTDKPEKPVKSVEVIPYSQNDTEGRKNFSKELDRETEILIGLHKGVTVEAVNKILEKYEFTKGYKTPGKRYSLKEKQEILNIIQKHLISRTFFDDEPEANIKYKLVDLIKEISKSKKLHYAAVKKLILQECGVEKLAEITEESFQAVYDKYTIIPF